MSEELTFRWLGVQGIELRLAGVRLLLDPFFTRPRLADLIRLRRLTPERALSTRLAPAADAILVSHAHYDHLMDVPDVAANSRAPVYGSANAGKILALAGLPAAQFRLIRPGQRLDCGPFQVEVLAGKHVHLALDPLVNGPLRPGLVWPLRAVDFRMDAIFGFRIHAGGASILYCPGDALQPADVLFTGIAWGLPRYRRLLEEVRPRLLVPVHWDNFLRPLDRPLVEAPQPGGMSVARLRRLVAAAAPATDLVIPEYLKQTPILTHS